jgi:hypothetical protein
MTAVKKQPTHWIYSAPKGSTKNSKIYFYSYAEAKRYIEKYIPGEKGIYHIYPVDQSGYTSKNRGTSWRTDRARTI